MDIISLTHISEMYNHIDNIHTNNALFVNNSSFLSSSSFFLLQS